VLAILRRRARHPPAASCCCDTHGAPITSHHRAGQAGAIQRALAHISAREGADRFCSLSVRDLRLQLPAALSEMEQSSQLPSAAAASTPTPAEGEGVLDEALRWLAFSGRGGGGSGGQQDRSNSSALRQLVQPVREAAELRLEAAATRSNSGGGGGGDSGGTHERHLQTHDEDGHLGWPDGVQEAEHHRATATAAAPMAEDVVDPWRLPLGVYHLRNMITSIGTLDWLRFTYVLENRPAE
jgi:hypothetical protein